MNLRTQSIAVGLLLGALGNTFLFPQAGILMAQTGELPVIPPEDAYGLQDVTDNTFLSAEDRPAYFGLLDHASLIESSKLRLAARKFVQERKEKTGLPTFVDMIKNPVAFRGKPVILRGHLHLTQSYDARDNDYGIETLYDVSFFDEDSQTNLTTVIFLEKPDNLEVGGEMVNGVEIVGYFLKNYLYDSQDNHTRKAPLIMAKTITIQESKPLPPVVSPAIAYGAILAGFLVLIAVIWWTQRGDRKQYEKRLAKQNSGVPDFAGIVEAPDLPEELHSSDSPETT